MKREAILHSTLELISQLGVHNTPMSKIANHAGVAVGTIYHHFDSKEEILNELYLEIKKEFGAVVDRSLAINQSPQQTFSDAFKAIYRYYTENMLKFIFSEQVVFTPIITDKVKKEARQYYQAMFTFFEKEIEKDTLRDIPPDLIVTLCYGNIKSLIQMKLSDPDSVSSEILQEAIHTSWISIAKR